jgi:hypothetical protein
MAAGAAAAAAVLPRCGRVELAAAAARCAPPAARSVPAARAPPAVAACGAAAAVLVGEQRLGGMAAPGGAGLGSPKRSARAHIFA